VNEKTLPMSILLFITIFFLGSSFANAEDAEGTSRGLVSVQSDSLSNIMTIYVASEVITMDEDKPRATAVAVAGRRILGVGSKSDMLKLAGQRSVSVNVLFADKIIVPGLIDQHLHPLLSALTLSSEIISIEDWVLPEKTVKSAKNHEDYIRRLTNAEAAIVDPDKLLLSWGFHHYFHGKLTRIQLDSISSSRPIIVWHRSAHEFILNTAALESVGVNEALVVTLAPEIQKQINFAEGHFWERGAFEFLLAKLMPAIASPERLLKGLQFTENYLHSSGVTTSAEPGGSTGMYNIQVAVLGDAQTPFRFYFIPDGRTLAGLYSGQNLIDETEKQLSQATGNTAFLPKQVKLFSDGAIFSQLMQMTEGYTDNHHGEWMMEPAVFANTFKTYWDAGYQIHIHQNGDAGLEMVLDNLEENLQRNPRFDHRTTIVHFGFATEEQVARISRLGAIVSANPYYPIALADRYGEMGVGPKRSDLMVRLGDVGRAGVSFSFHSDMPMAPAQPLFLMWSAVNRMTPSGRVAGPNQRVSVQQALRAVTIDAAYSLRLEQEIGSIKTGKLANFTILDNSPFSVNPLEIKDIGIWGTVLEGRLQPLRD
jgi:predicted amidohydrolase YtcJ